MLPSYEKTYVNSEKNLQMLKEMYDSRINSSENRPFFFYIVQAELIIEFQ